MRAPRNITPEELAALLGTDRQPNVDRIQAHIENTRPHIEASLDGLLGLYRSPDRLEPQTLRMAHTADLFRHDPTAAAIMLTASLERLAVLSGEQRGRTAATGSEVTGSDTTQGDRAQRDRANHPSRTGSPAASLVQLQSQQDSQDDPADLAAITAEYPETWDEEHRRMHLAPFMCDLIDPNADHQTKVNALRHMVVCDPWRAVAGLGALVLQLMAEDASRRDICVHEVVDEMRAQIAAVDMFNRSQEG